MNSFGKMLGKWTVLLTCLSLPCLAVAAEQLNPAGKNVWDLYVYGNGDALAQVYTSLKLIMAPDGGGGSFRYLLIFLAMIALVVLAVRAGFNPAKNFVQMFSFILLVWVVTYGTQGARASVQIMDRLSNYNNVISGVPAIVAIPVSIVSQTGEWLTEQIEQNFSIPSSLKVSSGGQFDMFGKVIQDLNQFAITDPDLKRSVSAYISDCAVPAMALGKLGVRDLTGSSNLLSTLSKAQSAAIMTRYFPMTQQTASGGNTSCAAISQIPTNPDGTLAYSPQLGALMTCTQAYSCVSSDLSNYATVLTQATATQWQSTGVEVPFEQVMTDALSQAGAGSSASPLAGYSSPEGVILQKALVNSMAGTFRNAAMRTGNNELMMATSLAQAEQSQRTAWWTAAEIFRNMMGYVYVVLQAFIVAIVPIVVIGLMIPGFGAKIFVSYFQILVWLTLWAPMTSIINFLITIFGQSELQSTLGISGVSMQNSAVLSEQTNNLVIAAQFLGTLVPILTWGLVKGSMAFTEFISHGIGSSFAVQAGAQASTGNVSLGNLSMDNVGMHKYSTVMSAAVGQQQVQASFGTGHSLSELEAGGTMATANGQNETPSVNRSTGVKLKSSHGTSAAMSMDVAQSIVADRKNAASETRDTINRVGSLISEASSLAASANLTTSEQRSARAALSQAASEAVKATQSQASTVGGSIGVGAGVGKKGFGFDLSGRLEAGYQLQKNKANDKAASLQHAIDRVHQADESARRSLDASHSTGQQKSTASDSSTRRSVDDSLAKIESLSESFKQTESWTQSFQLERQTTEMDSQTMARAATGYDGAPAVNVAPALAAAAERLSSPPSNLAAHEPTFGSVSRGQSGISHEIEGRRANVEQKSEELGASAPTQLDTSIGAAIASEQGSLHVETGAAMKSAEQAQASARQSIADLRSWDPLQDTHGTHPLWSSLKGIL